MSTIAPQLVDPTVVGPFGALNGHSFASGGGGSSTSQTDLGYYPPAGYGCVSLSCDPEGANGDSSFGDGTIFVARMWVPASQALAAAGVGISVAATAGAAVNANGFVLYEDDGTQVATANESAGNLYNAGTGWKFLAFGATVAAQSTGRFVRLGLVVGGWSGVRLWYANRTGAANALNGGRTVANRRVVFNSGVTAYPASITPASYGTTTSFLPLYGLAAA